VFVDAGWIGADWDDLAGPAGGVDAGHPLRVLFSGGVGLRILIDRDSALRLDLATSPFEQRPAHAYATVGNVL